MSEDLDNIKKNSEDMSNDESMLKCINSVKYLLNNGFLPNDQAGEIIRKITINTPNNAKSETEKDLTGNLEPESDTFVEQTPKIPEKYGELLGYLKNAATNLNDDDYKNLSGMLENLENKAVETYQQKIDHNAALNSENENAKKRLTSCTQNSTRDISSEHTFTRDEIGAMSREEFDKNEKQIMNQLRRGLIR